MIGRDLVREVTCPEPYHWQQGLWPEWRLLDAVSTGRASTRSGINNRYRVVAYDYGIKHNILRLLVEAGCEVTVVPATMTAAEALALEPDGIFLSNGPGDPAAVLYAIEIVAALVEAGKPIFGICLGHQILALALGSQTHKMKFGHRGGNQPVQTIAGPPVKDPLSGSGSKFGPVAITSHNHGFAVSAGSLPDEVEVTHLNLNDNCIEGLRHRTKPIFSIQYHPEASPGPHDALDLFEQFVELMEQRRAR